MLVVVWLLGCVFVIGLVTPIGRVTLFEIGLVIMTGVVIPIMLFDFVPVIVGRLNKLPPPIPIPIEIPLVISGKVSTIEPVCRLSQSFLIIVFIVFSWGVVFVTVAVFVPSPLFSCGLLYSFALSSFVISLFILSLSSHVFISVGILSSALLALSSVPALKSFNPCITSSGLFCVSVGTVLLEAAPIPGGEGAADVATTAGKAGLSVVGQRGIRAGIGAAVGAASGLGLGLMNGAKGNRLWEDIGIGAASGAVIGLTSSPSGSLIRSISEDTAIENPSIFTSDTAGHITGDEGSTESVTTATATKTIPKFGRLGYYHGTEEVSGEYTIGSHITPISSSEENGISKEYNGVSASISRTVRVADEEPTTSSDVVKGTSLRVSKPSISLTNAEEGTTAESGTELNIINTKSILSGEEKSISSVDKYGTQSNENDLLRGSSTFREGINGEYTGTAPFKELSNTAISKKWLDTLTLTQKSPDEVLQGLNDLRAGSEASATEAEDHIPSDIRTWLDNERINNQITNDERVNEYGDLNKEGTKTATIEKTAPHENTINTIIKNDWENTIAGSITKTTSWVTRGIDIGLGIGGGSLLKLPTITGTKSKAITYPAQISITKPITRLITNPITKPITKTKPKTTTTTSTQTTTTTNTTTLSTAPTDNIIPLKTTGGLLLPTRHKKEPAQELFPFHGRIGRRPKLRARKSYYAFPDLLNENEYQFATGKRAHALKITPQNAKVYNRMFSQTLGMNILTQEQLERKARKTKTTKKKIF